METKSLSPETAALLSRLKTRAVKPERKVPIEPVGGPESRRSRRQNVCIQASMLSERLDEPVACVIRNLSATGARIEIVKTERKPFTSEEHPGPFHADVPAGADRGRLRDRLAERQRHRYPLSVPAAPPLSASTATG